jgi:hypothetical protein
MNGWEIKEEKWPNPFRLRHVCASLVLRALFQAKHTSELLHREKAL